MIKKEYGKNGIFHVFFNCNNCGKELVIMKLSFERDKIAYANDGKIKEVLQKEMERHEIVYCCRCGKSIYI